MILNNNNKNETSCYKGGRKGDTVRTDREGKGDVKIF
jgi:hypothetical protein